MNQHNASTYLPSAASIPARWNMAVVSGCRTRFAPAVMAYLVSVCVCVCVQVSNKNSRQMLKLKWGT